jgi:hypothetical protein
MTPRGIRNHNPGNIDQTRPRTPWQGAVPVHELTDDRFEQFTSPEFGIRALARVLITYQDKHGLDSVARIIGRYAPPKENRTDAYINAVAHAIGVAPTERINVHRFEVMLPLVRAIVRHENGVQPYSEATLTRGLALAGIAPEKPKPLAKSTTMQGAALSGAGATGEVITQSAQQLGVVAEVSPLLQAAFALLLVAGVALTIYGRLKVRERTGE